MRSNCCNAEIEATDKYLITYYCSSCKKQLDLGLLFREPIAQLTTLRDSKEVLFEIEKEIKEISTHGAVLPYIWGYLAALETVKRFIEGKE